MPTWEIIIAILGSGALSAFVTHWFDRRKTNGEASLAYAQASGLVADQNAELLLEIKKLRAEQVDSYCEVKALKAVIVDLRLALGRQLEKQE